MKNKTDRYSFIDSLRGFAVISMILFHFAWDLRYILGLEFNLYGDFGFLWQQSICWTFILISGFCFSLSHHPFKNGFIVFLAGCIVSAVTIIFMKDSAIYYGVLTFLGLSMLILAPIRTYLSKIPAFIGICLSFILFILLHNINDKSIVFGIFDMPCFLYKNMFSALLGFPPNTFSSSDYFPLLPWLFLFLTGFFIGCLLNNKRAPKFLYFKIPFFEWVGRRALIIYLAHQPILYGITLFLGVFINGH